MNVLDLFSGIGGFSLGLERAGMKTVAFCEIEPYCRAVLRKHWPDVPIYHDVRELTGEKLRADGISVDAICGGFPCQDISCAGKREGIDGKRSGLWAEYARIIGEVRPAYAIVENVAALLIRGLERVLGDLATLGYDAEWHCIPASAVGAPHRRDRIWIVAYANGHGYRPEYRSEKDCSAPSSDQGEGDQRQRLWIESGRSGAVMADTNGEGLEGYARHVNNGHEPGRVSARQNRQTDGEGDRAADVADSARLLRNGGEHHGRSHSESAVPLSELGNGCRNTNVVHTERGRLPARHEQHHEGNAIFLTPRSREGAWNNIGETWRTEPRLDRVAYGVPAQMERCTALGNAVVPQIPEIIGRAIVAARIQLARAA